MATDTGTWTTLERGLPDEVEVRCVTLHPTQPGVVFAGTQAGPYRSTDAGDTWERMHFPGDEPVVWSFEIHPADARVMYVGTQDDVSINSTLMIIAASAQTPERVYCAARRGQVFGTEEGGKSWQPYPLPAEGVYALACV